MSSRHHHPVSSFRLLIAAVVGLGAMAVAPSARAGDFFWDGCPADAQFTMTHGGYSAISGDASYYYRPYCPWYLLDFNGATSFAGRELQFHGGWDLVQPDNQADCEARTVRYVVARHHGNTLYEVVAEDSMHGEWDNGYCGWRRASGNNTIVLPGTDHQYRLLVRAEYYGAGAPAWGWGYVTRAD